MSLNVYYYYTMLCGSGVSREHDWYLDGIIAALALLYLIRVIDATISALYPVREVDLRACGSRDAPGPGSVSAYAEGHHQAG